MGCGETFGRIILSLFNCIFFLASGLMLAFGITAKVNPGGIATVLNYLLPAATRSDLQNTGVDISGIIVSNAVFMIVIGVIGLVISGFGFVGACCLVKWMLILYAILMILLVLGEVALIIFAAVYTDTFKNVIQQGMKESLTRSFSQDFFYNGTSFTVPSDAVSLSWATVQIKEKCCGAYNYTDYATLSWTPKYNNNSIPVSCCTYNGTDFPPSISSFNNIPLCLSGNAAYINQQNCYDGVINDINKFIQQYKGIAIGIAAGIVGIELILIIISFVLCCKSERSDKFV